MDSSSKINGGLTTFTIKISGNAIPDILAVLSVMIKKEINKIATAKIKLRDGQPKV